MVLNFNRTCLLIDHNAHLRLIQVQSASSITDEFPTAALLRDPV